MTRQQLADALDDPETKAFVAKALAHQVAADAGYGVSVETAWMMLAPEMRFAFIFKVDHVVELLRAPESPTPRKRAPRNA